MNSRDKTLPIRALVGVLMTLTIANTEAAIDFGAYPVKNVRDCFAGPFGDYDNWINSLIDRNPNKPEGDARAMLFSRYETELLPRNDYENAKATLDCNWFEYPVDDGLVKGYIIQPKKRESKIPAVIYNRGGNLNFGGQVFGALLRNQFNVANAGYTVIGSQYRGTFEKNPAPEFSDQFGGADVNDVLELLNILDAMKTVDNTRLGMYGQSRGGMQTLLTAKASHRFKALVVKAGSANALKGLEFRPEMENVFKARIPDYEKNKAAALQARSAIFWLDQLDPVVPILILHGQADTRVSARQALWLAEGLQKLDHPYKLIIYPQDNHGLQKHQAEAGEEIIRWFDRYL